MKCKAVQLSGSERPANNEKIENSIISMAKDIEAILNLLLYKTKTQQIKVQDRKDQAVRAS